MYTKALLALLVGFVLLAGCAAPATPATPLATMTPTLSLAAPTLPPLTPGAATPLPGMTTAPSTGTVSICNDQQSTALIDSFKTAILNTDGPLLSSLVSPSRGMDVGFFRDGTVITYMPEHAKFLFETTFEVDWGTEPGSGAAVRGAFHDVVVPELVETFSQPYTLHCNELKLGGATYEAEWPYEGEFYSVHFPGTAANGNMDWQTWVMGIENVNNKRYVYALIRFFWEP